jgi:hypothetical protein
MTARYDDLVTSLDLAAKVWLPIRLARRAAADVPAGEAVDITVQHRRPRTSAGIAVCPGLPQHRSALDRSARIGRSCATVSANSASRR